jgi:hypothetical protein
MTTTLAGTPRIPDHFVETINRLLWTDEGRRRGLTYDDVGEGMRGTWYQVTRERWDRWFQRTVVDRKPRPVTVVDVERRPRTGEILSITVRVEDGGPEPPLRFTIRDRGSFVLAGYRKSGRGNWLNLGSFPPIEEIAPKEIP